ncbi:MAG: tetratricopeptide repeat protein [Candidatus Krumholzibacteria bacterium]|nr:tetratricopeptide repeat protein [Candidatus Krumholzibacteria bacterium]
MKRCAAILIFLVILAPDSGCGPDKAVKYYNLGLEAAKRDDYAEAVRLWENAVKYRPDDPETRYNLGAALVALKRYTEAETHLREAVALNSLDADAYQLLGKSLEEQEKLPEAKKAYEFAIGIKPTHVRSLIGLASIALTEGQNRSAENYATQAVELDPGNLEANMLLSEAYFRNGDFNAAYGQVLSARNLGPTSTALFFLTGKIAYSRRMYADALEALQSARTLGAATDELFRYLGLTYLALGDTDEAEKEFRLSIYKNRENAKAWNGLAETYIKEKRWREAGEAVEQAALIDAFAPETLLNGAAVRMGSGDLNGAVRTLEALRTRPEYPPITDYYLGHAFLRMRNDPQARAAFRRFIGTWEGDQALVEEAKAIVDRLAP